MDTSRIEPEASATSSLSSSQLTRVKRIHDTLSEADSSSLEEWISDFEKDRDPEKEILIWEDITRAYECYCSDRHLNVDQEQNVLKVFGALWH